MTNSTLSDKYLNNFNFPTRTKRTFYRTCTSILRISSFQKKSVIESRIQHKNAKDNTGSLSQTFCQIHDAQ